MSAEFPPTEARNERSAGTRLTRYALAGRAARRRTARRRGCRFARNQNDCARCGRDRRALARRRSLALYRRGKQRPAGDARCCRDSADLRNFRGTRTRARRGRSRSAGPRGGGCRRRRRRGRGVDAGSVACRRCGDRHFGCRRRRLCRGCHRARPRHRRIHCGAHGRCRFGPGARGRYGDRRRDRGRSAGRLDAHEGRNGAEDCAQRHFNGGNGSFGAGLRQLDG